MKLVSIGLSAIIVGAFMLVGSAQGAIVSWGAAQNISTPTEVSLSGTLLDAMEIYTGGSGAVTVNTVLFSTATSAANDIPLSGGSVKLTSDGAGKIIVTTSSHAASGISLGDADYTTLLSRFSYSPNGTVFMSSLIPGRSYLVQVWASQNTASLNFPTLAGSPSVELDVNTGSGVGQFAIGTFVAGATTDSFTYSALSGSVADLNAIQVRLLPVPEPNGVILIGIAIAGFAASVRRRQV
jgi:hypothetical protein